MWRDGVLDGPATVQGKNGDKMEFVYVKVRSFLSNMVNFSSYIFRV